jgi:predicted ferric reductase
MNEDKKQKLLSECQDYHYKQSSNVSSLSRYIIYAIIATIWLIINSSGFDGINTLLKIALFASFIYLLLDILHYFIDAVRYKREYFQFDKETMSAKMFAEHEERMNKYSKRSGNWICCKFVCLIIISVGFLVGMCLQLA